MGRPDKGMKQKLFTLLLLTFLSAASMAQVRCLADGYGDGKIGKYSRLSTDSTLLRTTHDSLAPQTKITLFTEQSAFFFPPSSGILLFKDRHDKSGAVKLLKPSLLHIDTIFYEQIFKSENVYPYSFAVWYAIKINGLSYYTDYQPHDFVAFTHMLPDHQLFMLFALKTGYDNYYATGYPNHFHAVVFSVRDHMLTLFYCSEELPFICEDEFWEPEWVKYRDLTSDGVLEFELFGQNNYKAIWTGKKLIRID